MTDADRERFAKCLLAAGELYGKPISKSVADLWWLVLRGYDIAAVEAALAIHASDPDTGQFMPKPADIIKRMSGTSQDSALRAWADVDAAVRKVGPYRSVAFADPIACRVVKDMGGWILLCEKDDDAWPFVAREFENRYRGYKQRGEAPDAPDHLPGIAEADCSRLGRPNPEPAVIGAPRLAALEAA